MKRRVSEVVITRRTRNAVVGNTARGFESHALRQNIQIMREEDVYERKYL